MSSSVVRAFCQSSPVRLNLVAASLLCATALAGCSADLARLDMANVGLSDTPAHNPAPIPSQPMLRNFTGSPPETAAPSTPYSYNPSPYQPPASAAMPVRQAGLPGPVPSAPEPRTPIGPPLRAEPPRAEARSTGGRVVEVVPGDTLYGISRRHGVSISSLMSTNGLQGPTIFPGQKLTLPADGRRRSPARRTELASRPYAPPPRPITSPPVEASAAAPSDWSGTYTVSPRDSLYSIARRHNIKVAELQAANGIGDPSRLRAGTVLKIPGAATSAHADAPTTSPAPVPPAVAREAQAELAPDISTRPRIINAAPEAPQPPPERVAVAAPKTPVLNDASPATERTKPQSAAVAGKFRWPARGRIVAGFGRRPDRTHNDGINILVPQGASVHAAEAGTVAYAGSELKGYGNLILIRHEGNWISAYAHNDSLLVRRGDHVERGQEIAKAGKTGAVDQPQLHFELRQGSKPVDPVPHLER
ncbi:MAG: LysM peptidoglycan-binding domain-containing protein [Hyphomicrobiaceae bacterium]